MLTPIRRSNRASMLVIMLMVTIILMALVMVVGESTILNMRNTSDVTDKRRARYAAYAGLQKSLAKLQEDNHWNGPITDEPLPGDPNMAYSVEVKNNLFGDLAQNGIPEDKQVPAGAVLLDAVAGPLDDASRTYKGVTAMVGLAVPRNPVFEQAALGDSVVNMTDDALTEAYDFDKYDLESRRTETRDNLYGFVNDTNIDVCPKRGYLVGHNRVDISGNAVVDGDVKLPYQSASSSGPSTGLIQDDDYTGTENILKESTDMPSFVAPYDPESATQTLDSFPLIQPAPQPTKDRFGNDTTYTPPAYPQTLTPQAYKSVTVPPGQTLRLTSGTYYFQDLFDVQGKIELTNLNDGPVIVYVGKKMMVGSGATLNEEMPEGANNPTRGGVDAQGNVIGTGGRPRDLQVYFTDEKENDKYDPNSPEPTPVATPTPNPNDPDGSGGFTSLASDPPEREFISEFDMQNGSIGTMVVAGRATRGNLNGARLMGAIIADRLNLSGKTMIQFDKNLLEQNFVVGSEWALHGVHERSVKKK